MKLCKYCANEFEPDQMELHENLCAKNPDVAEKQRKLGEIEDYKKTAIVIDGILTEVYWAHSAGNRDFTDDLPFIKDLWNIKWPNEDHNSHMFLRERGFRVMTRSE